MFSARTVIIAAVVVLILSLVGTVVSMLQPPDQNGLGADSYGTRGHGYRALYEILGALGATEQRELAPPGASLDRSSTLVIWSPDDDLVRTEPVYLENVVAWIREGGRAIIAFDIAAARAHRISRLFKINIGDRPLNELLGLKDVGVQLVDVLGPPPMSRKHAKPVIETDSVDDNAADDSASDGSASDDTSSDNADQSEAASDDADDFEKWPSRRKRLSGSRVPAEYGTLDEGVRQLLEPELFPVATLDARSEGELSEQLAEVKQLLIPRELQTLQVGKSKPAGTLSVTSEGQSWIVAAEYKLGEGNLILVSEPAIFDNRLIGVADNPVLAVRLVDERKGPIVWDEFYHGLTIRGSMLFLLTRGSYALVAGMILLTTIGWLWRQARFLGPPLAAQPVSRRSVREYVEAMARFFKRGAESRRFMLGEVRQGVLWSLRRKTGALRGREAWANPVGTESHVAGSAAGGLPHSGGTGQPPARGVQRATPSDRESLEAILAVLSRHDPAAARRLRDAVERADRVVSDPRKVGDREILEAVKGLADCL